MEAKKGEKELEVVVAFLESELKGFEEVKELEANLERIIKREIEVPEEDYEIVIDYKEAKEVLEKLEKIPPKKRMEDLRKTQKDFEKWTKFLKDLEDNIYVKLPYQYREVLLEEASKRFVEVIGEHKKEIKHPLTVGIFFAKLLYEYVPKLTEKMDAWVGRGIIKKEVYDAFFTLFFKEII